MTSTAPGTASRILATRILVRWLERRDFPDRLLPEAAEDRGFVMDMVFGTVRYWRTLEWVLARHVKRRPAPELRAALLLGAHQILFMEDVADHAALHATVESVKHGQSGQSGFVNAVLRSILREREEILAELAEAPLAVRTSHPDALVDRWTAVHGASDTAALCDWNNQPAQTVVALLPDANISAADLLSRWQAAGVAADKHPAHEDCLVVGHGHRVEELEGYKEGFFVPQDAATLAAVELLKAAPGQRILDACAAPGGKTGQIAARMERCGELVAMDLHDDRLSRLEENLRRLRLDQWVRVLPGDSGQAEVMEPLGLFDRILLDAPCTNSGVLRRRPDARWRFSAARLRTMVAQQRRLLLNLLPHLATGGRLVYSTCSLEPEENQELIAAILAECHGFKIAAARSRFPPRDNTDGAFACAIDAVKGHR